MESMSAVDLKTRAFVDDVLVRSPFGKTLGFELVSLEPDKVRLRLPFKPENVTLENIVHGGAVAALIDTAGAIVSASNAPLEMLPGATSTLNISYLAPAGDNASLTATARTVSRTKGRVVSDVVVHEEGRKLVAKALVTLRLFVRRQGAAVE
ncbi:MAG: PaaI family thioesterase [Deltaproteobacteria bacterium]|nr:PaaI family thioesterase [Deltaproteobacteria bacterium]MBW1819697.1 PaaI family thioesterase [Deltaproteobacteria bacterium]MBW2285309.1 PaaI family thioesterase [Deltaproteobacteria bacterium]